MTRVYISSSYSDLVECREAAARAVRRLRLEPINMENYTASDRRPLDVCLRDVRGCDLFVGIVGRRYGSRAPGSDLSFTHHEFEEAVRNDIPCLIFLLDVDAEWEGESDADPTAIDAFRSDLSERKLVQWFRDARDLETSVTAALSNARDEHRGETLVEIPPLLPYMLDRSLQRDELADAIGTHRKRGSRRPILVIIHGDEREEHGGFIERLKRITLPEFLELPSDSPVQHIDVPWAEPSGTPMQRLGRMKSHIAEELTRDRQASREQVAQAISHRRGPVIVTSAILAGEWQRNEPQLVHEWFTWWSEWPDLPHRQPLLVLLSFVYADTGDLGFMRKRAQKNSNAAMERVVEEDRTELQDRLTLMRLSRLSSVREHDVMRWVKEEAGAFCQRRRHGSIRDPLVLVERLRPWIRERFRDSDVLADSGGIHMEILAPELRIQLEQCLSEGSP